jgi:hypothetical protein
MTYVAVMVVRLGTRLISVNVMSFYRDRVYVQGVADGCERVPELVGEHRQELTLATVRVAQRLFGFLTCGDVVEAVDGSHDIPACVLQRTDIHDDGNPRAVGPLDEHFGVTGLRERAGDYFGHGTLLVRHETAVRSRRFESVASHPRKELSLQVYLV